MVVLEAMSHKLPVIVSSNQYCGFSEHLGADEAIILDNPKISKEISHGIKTLYDQVDFRKKIAENGLKKAKKINWDTTTSCTLKSYSKIYQN
jgi:glycosyltransferase involved in cell wall biosynthesis